MKTIRRYYLLVLPLVWLAACAVLVSRVRPQYYTSFMLAGGALLLAIILAVFARAVRPRPLWAALGLGASAAYMYFCVDMQAWNVLLPAARSALKYALPRGVLYNELGSYMEELLLLCTVGAMLLLVWHMLDCLMTMTGRRNIVKRFGVLVVPAVWCVVCFAFPQNEQLWYMLPCALALGMGIGYQLKPHVLWSLGGFVCTGAAALLPIEKNLVDLDAGTALLAYLIVEGLVCVCLLAGCTARVPNDEAKKTPARSLEGRKAALMEQREELKQQIAALEAPKAAPAVQEAPVVIKETPVVVEEAPVIPAPAVVRTEETAAVVQTEAPVQSAEDQQIAELLRQMDALRAQVELLQQKKAQPVAAAVQPVPQKVSVPAPEVQSVPAAPVAVTNAPASDAQEAETEEISEKERKTERIKSLLWLLLAVPEVIVGLNVLPNLRGLSAMGTCAMFVTVALAAVYALTRKKKIGLAAIYLAYAQATLSLIGNFTSRYGADLLGIFRILLMVLGVLMCCCMCLPRWQKYAAQQKAKAKAKAKARQEAAQRKAATAASLRAAVEYPYTEADLSGTAAVQSASREERVNELTKLLTEGKITSEQFTVMLEAATKAEPVAMTRPQRIYDDFMRNVVVNGYKSPSMVRYPMLEESMIHEGDMAMLVGMKYHVFRARYILVHLDAPNSYGAMLRCVLAILIDDDFNPLIVLQPLTGMGSTHEGVQVYKRFMEVNQ